MYQWVLKYLPQILTGTVWVLTFGIGYFQGYANCNTGWKERTQKETGRYLEQINEMTNVLRQKEIENQEKINLIVGEQLEREEQIKNEHEKVIADLRNGQYEFNGVRNCPDTAKTGEPVSGNSPATSGLVCYSKAELQQKIEGSLAIAEECDRLAERYEKLKEVYNVRR